MSDTPFPAGMSFEDIVRKCRAESKRFTDGDFPPADVFLESRLHGIKWQRVDQIARSSIKFMSDRDEPSELVQGRLADCWFITPLSLIAQRKELLQRLFVSKDKYKDIGVYVFAFFHEGEWRNVLVDDWIPCIDGVPVYVRSQDECWPLLLEKAYAKLRGGWAALHTGAESAALTALSGGPALMLSKLSWEVVSTARLCVVRAHTAAQGIIPAHTYGVRGVRTVDELRLVRVRNPHGRNEWQGAYSRQWPEWPMALRTQLQPDRLPPGEWWMRWEDFAATFAQAVVVPKLPDSLPPPRAVRLTGSWDGQGGSLAAQALFANPQYRVRLAGASPVYGILHKPVDVLAALCVVKVPADYPKLRLHDAVSHLYNTVAQSDVTNIECTSLQFDSADDSDYVFIPFTLNREVSASYVINIMAPEANLTVTPMLAAAARVVQIEDEFTLRSAGGTPLLPTWANNPQFLLSVPRACDLTVSVEQLGYSWTRIDLDPATIAAAAKLSAASGTAGGTAAAPPPGTTVPPTASPAAVTLSLTTPTAPLAAPAPPVAPGSSLLMPVQPEQLVRLGFAVFAGTQRVADLQSAGAPVLAPEDWSLSFGVRQAQVSATGRLEAGTYVIVANTGSTRERCPFVVRVETDGVDVKLDPLQ